MILCPRCGSGLAPERRCPSCEFVLADDRRWDFEPADRAERYFDESEFRYRYADEPAHYWHRARRRLLAHVVARFARPGATLLDVGCGCGYVSSALEGGGYRVRAVDLSSVALDYCQERGLTRLCRADVADLPFRQEYDVATAFDLLEHMPEDAPCVRSLRRAVVRGGLVIVTVPAFSHLWSSWDRQQRHALRWRGPWVGTSLLAVARRP